MPRTSTRVITPVLDALGVDSAAPLPKVEDDIRLTYEIGNLDRQGEVIPHPHGTAQGLIVQFPILPPFPVPSFRLRAGPRGARIVLIHAQASGGVLVTISRLDVGTFGPPPVGISVQSWGPPFQSSLETGQFDSGELTRMFTVESQDTFTEGKDAPLPLEQGDFVYLHAFLGVDLFFTIIWDEPV